MHPVRNRVAASRSLVEAAPFLPLFDVQNCVALIDDAWRSEPLPGAIISRPDGVCEANRVPCDMRLLAQVHCKLPKLPRQPAIVDLGLMIRSQISNQGRLSCLTLYFIDPLLNVLHAMPQALVSAIGSYQRTVVVGHSVVLRSAFPVDRRKDGEPFDDSLSSDHKQGALAIRDFSGTKFRYRYRGSLPSNERARGEWRRYKLRIAAKGRAFLIFRAPPVRILMEVISRHGQLSWSGLVMQGINSQRQIGWPQLLEVAHVAPTDVRRHSRRYTGITQLQHCHKRQQAETSPATIVTLPSPNKTKARRPHKARA
jgi:hypothetical protein